MGERLDDAGPVLLFVDGTHSHMGEDAPMALFRPASPNKDPANTSVLEGTARIRSCVVRTFQGILGRKTVDTAHAVSNAD